MSNGMTLFDKGFANKPAPLINTDLLVAELTNFKQKAERLSVINELHVRLSGATDLASMIEAFSVWLMPVVEHELIGYNNPARKRTHLFCSCHGPKRRHIRGIADNLFQGDSDKNPTAGWIRIGDYYVREWRLCSRHEGSVVLVCQSGGQGFQDTQLIDEGLQILKGQVNRVLDYEDLFDQARRDSLTGLANRRVLEERIDSLLEISKRHGYPITIASMDLDNFKQVNDTLGHAEGDRILQKVAVMLGDMVRGSDLLVRMGGDEFLVVLPDTNLQAARRLANRLCNALEQLDVVVSGSRLGISIGLVQWHEGLKKDEWLQKADEALYQAKGVGKSNLKVVSSEERKPRRPVSPVGPEMMISAGV
jgi:diguanylate cyclase (GGDEF)-like protein